MDDCLFCKIANKEINADIIKESKNAIAFKDINPVAPYHILVIPKIHIKSVMDLNEHNPCLISEVITLANDVLKNVLKINNGSRWVINSGEDGGQTVFHLHLHLLAGRKLNWPPG